MGLELGSNLGESGPRGQLSTEADGTLADPPWRGSGPPLAGTPPEGGLDPPLGTPPSRVVLTPPPEVCELGRPERETKAQES